MYKIEELAYFCLFCHLFGTLVLSAGHPAVSLSSGPVRVGIVRLLAFKYILNIYAVFCKRFMNGHFNSEMIPFSYLKRFSPEVFLCKGFRILIFGSFLHLEGCLYSLQAFKSPERLKADTSAERGCPVGRTAKVRCASECSLGSTVFHPGPDRGNAGRERKGNPVPVLHLRSQFYGSCPVLRGA